MASQETKDAIQSTALAVVEQQQSIVGGALVGSAGAGVLAEGSQSQFDILEQIRDLQTKIRNTKSKKSQFESKRLKMIEEFDMDYKTIEDRLSKRYPEFVEKSTD